MSLDVYLSAPLCPTCLREPATLYSDNITHNLNQMADSAGLYQALWRPDEVGWKKAHQLEQALTSGLSLLRSDPGRFEAMNPKNGWGSYRGLVAFVESYLDACRKWPDADVSVCR